MSVGSRLFIISFEDNRDSVRIRLDFEAIESLSYSEFQALLCQDDKLSCDLSASMGTTDESVFEMYDSNQEKWFPLNDMTTILSQRSSLLHFLPVSTNIGTGGNLLAIKGKRFYSLEENGASYTCMDRKVIIKDVTEVADRSLDGNTGFSSWDASIVLAKYFQMNAAVVNNKKIIELGAGTGLVSIFASILGAAYVYATDLEYSLPNLMKNIDANSLSHIEVQELDWYFPEKNTIVRDQVELDIVVAADCVWLEHLIEPFVNTLLSINAKQIYIAYQLRTMAAYNQLVSLLRENHYEMKAIETKEYHPEFYDDVICIYRVCKV